MTCFTVHLIANRQHYFCCRQNVTACIFCGHFDERIVVFRTVVVVRSERQARSFPDIFVCIVGELLRGFAWCLITRKTDIRLQSDAEEFTRIIPKICFFVVVGIKKACCIVYTVGIGCRFIGDRHPRSDMFVGSSRFFDKLRIEIVIWRKNRKNREIITVHAVHPQIVPGYESIISVVGRSVCITGIVLRVSLGIGAVFSILFRFLLIVRRVCSAALTSNRYQSHQQY